MARSGLTVWGLVQGNDGANITQASLSGISYKVTRTEADGTKVNTGSGSLTVSAVVFDSPVTGNARVPSGSYNFLALLPASAFQVGGLWHRIAVTFTPSSGEVWVQTWRTKPIPDV